MTLSRPPHPPPRWPRASAALAAAGAAIVACVPGYDPCFVPASIVSDVRVLAVRADPPEALFDTDGSGVPSSVPVVHVRALVAGQGPEERLRLRARLCLPTASLRCPAESAAVEGALSPKGASEAAVDLRATPALLALARERDPLHGYGGIRLQLEVDAAAGSDHALASKLLLFSPSATTPHPNQPIELASVDFTRKDEFDQSAAPGGTATLFVPLTYGLRPRLAPLADGSPALEEYDVVDLAGRLVHLREQASYDFFTGPELIFGDLRSVNGNPVGAYSVGGDTGAEPAAGDPEPKNGLVRVTPLSGADAHLWVVGRDSRGAVAWAALRVRSLDERICDRGDGVPCAAGRACCPTLFFGCQ